MYTIFYIPCPSTEEAKRIGRALLEKRLVACANTFPVGSMYWWKGAIEEADEVVLLVKTRDELADAVEAEVTALHPYEVPCVARTGMRGNGPFENWIREETGQS